MVDIPKVFDHPGAAFVTLPTGIKFPPNYKGWQEPKNWRDYKRASKHGGNVGIIPANGYIGLDQDNPAAFSDIELPTSTRWETRPGRLGMRFKCSDDIPALLAKYGKKPDLGQLYLFKDGKSCGEVKLQRTYQVIPPSHKFIDPDTGEDAPPGKGNRVDYKLLDSSPPAEISLAKLLADLQSNGITFSEKKKEYRLEANAEKLKSKAKEARLKKVGSDEARARSYAEAALHKEAETLKNTPADSHNRNNQLNNAAFALGQFVATGVLTGDEVIATLALAADDTGLAVEDIKKTLRSGLEAGKQHPREIPAPPIDTDFFENSEADNEQAHKLKALIERIKADPIEAIRDPDVLAEMAEMKKSDPNRFEFFTLLLAKKTRHPAKLFDKMVDAHIVKTNRENPERNPAATAAGREILERGNPIQAHMDHVKERVCGGEKAARVVLLAAYSAFMSNGDRIHADVVGGAQSGKSTVTTEVLDTFPQENVMVTAEASPKSLYYLAQQDPERLKDAIVYIDDARPEHIPVLKTFRNEGNIISRNLTVADGEVLELVVSYRPVVLASAVTPLRDMEGQATSRAFLISVPDATPDEERMVRAKIRQQIATSALFSEKRDSSKEILQEMGRILRDEGIRDVVIPFDVEEPPGADRRGTGQFMRLIKVSAFVNQFQRPVAELEDGRKFVLATYEDFEQAARVWFDFAEGQEFKISSKVIEVLEKLPGDWPGRTATMLAKELEKGQRTIERYLEDLYEAGIASREKISSPGMPWGYWVESELRQKALSQISDTSDCTMIHDRITTENLCRKYMAKFSSDSLKDSSKRFFFNNHDIVIKKIHRGERELTSPVDGSGEDTPTLSPPSHFPKKLS